MKTSFKKVLLASSIVVGLLAHIATASAESVTILTSRTVTAATTMSVAGTTNANTTPAARLLLASDTDPVSYQIDFTGSATNAGTLITKYGLVFDGGTAITPYPSNILNTFTITNTLTGTNRQVCYGQIPSTTHLGAGALYVISIQNTAASGNSPVVNSLKLRQR